MSPAPRRRRPGPSAPVAIARLPPPTPPPPRHRIPSPASPRRRPGPSAPSAPVAVARLPPPSPLSCDSSSRSQRSRRRRRSSPPAPPLVGGDGCCGLGGGGGCCGLGDGGGCSSRVGLPPFPASLIKTSFWFCKTWPRTKQTFHVKYSADTRPDHQPYPPDGILSSPVTPFALRHVVVVQAQPAVAERLGPCSRSLAPRLRLPRHPRLLRLLLRLHLLLRNDYHRRRLIHIHSHQPHLRRRRRRRRPRLRPYPRLGPRAQPLRSAVYCRPRRAHSLLVPRLPRPPRSRVLLLAPDLDPGPTPRPGERPPLRPQLRRALHPRLRLLPVPDANGAVGDASHPHRVGECKVLPGALGTRHPGARGWAVSPSFCVYCYRCAGLCVQSAVCSCICHWVELCSDDVARFFSKIDSFKPT